MRYKTFLISAIIGFAPGLVLACPDPSQGGRDFIPGAGWYDLVAGGDVDLSYCREDWVGFVAVEPDFSMEFWPEPGERIEFEALADCDAVLLVRTASRNYYFNDDAPNADSRIVLTHPSGGLYDIWVGTYSDSNCPAELNISTYRGRNSRAGS